MDLFEELENVATNATGHQDADDEPTEQEISRWQTLFGYSFSEAVTRLKSQKSDLS